MAAIYDSQIGCATIFLLAVFALGFAKSRDVASTKRYTIAVTAMTSLFIFAAAGLTVWSVFQNPTDMATAFESIEAPSAEFTVKAEAAYALFSDYWYTLAVAFASVLWVLVLFFVKRQTARDKG